MPLPDYDALDRPDASGLPLAWRLWGGDDQVGTLNNITPETVTAAARLIKKGRRFPLDLPIHVPLGMLGPGAHWIRGPAQQTLYKKTYAGLVIRDDKVDNLFLQSSTQWDGLSHVGDPHHGFYNGVQDEDVTQLPGTRNGIENYVRFGIAGRAVLADLVRHFAAEGRAWDPVGSMVASADDLRACLDRQQVSLLPGDILLVRMGWVGRFLAATADEDRERLYRQRDYSGLSGGEDMWRFLWDSRVAAVASDTVTVEAWPLAEGKVSLHLAIARLGIVLGELFDLDGLAADSAETGDYTAFFTSSPLNVRGGTGAPPNAMAIR